MVADGLTKLLPCQKHAQLVRQLGMEHVGHLLAQINWIGLTKSFFYRYGFTIYNRNIDCFTLQFSGNNLLIFTDINIKASVIRIIDIAG
jgi:hypothetical protein